MLSAGQPLIKLCPKFTRISRLKLENKRLKGQFREWDQDELSDLKIQVTFTLLQFNVMNNSWLTMFYLHRFDCFVVVVVVIFYLFIYLFVS